MGRDDSRSAAAAQGIGASLRSAHRLYLKLLQDHLGTRGLTVAQYLHLRVLREQKGLFQNEISARLGIEKASSTAVLDALERDGLIERQRDGEDRRRLKVTLTGKGEKLADEMMSFARQIASAATDGVDADDLASFFATMDRVIDNLSRAISTRR